MLHDFQYLHAYFFKQFFNLNKKKSVVQKYLKELKYFLFHIRHVTKFLTSTND